ncbi:LOW QUALITY PROTEIN: hypothetical protein HZS_5436 [Henneguya salminicola]|nr:LOW QUALITY PROTEIN: hypothetical protein HZS_5436 [Henneguya salminicola]
MVFFVKSGGSLSAKDPNFVILVLSQINIDPRFQSLEGNIKTQNSTIIAYIETGEPLYH